MLSGHTLVGKMHAVGIEMEVAHLACSLAKPLCTFTDDGIPGKSDGSSGSRKKLISVRSAKLTR